MTITSRRGLSKSCAGLAFPILFLISANQTFVQFAALGTLVKVFRCGSCLVGRGTLIIGPRWKTSLGGSRGRRIRVLWGKRVVGFWLGDVFIGYILTSRVPCQAWSLYRQLQAYVLTPWFGSFLRWLRRSAHLAHFGA